MSELQGVPEGNWVTPVFYKSERDLKSEKENSPDNFIQNMFKKSNSRSREDGVGVNVITYSTPNQSTANELYKQLKKSSHAFLMDRDVRKTTIVNKGEKAIQAYRLTAATTARDSAVLGEELRRNGISVNIDCQTRTTMKEDSVPAKFLYGSRK